MYTDTNELPPNVKSALSADEQTTWLESYNHTESAEEAWKSVESTARIFEFFANAEMIDSQNELIKFEALESAMPHYIATGGPVIDMHTNRIVGTVYSYEPALTPAGHKAVRCRAAIYKGQTRYDMVWDDIKSGSKSAVSIGGDKLQQHYTCADGHCHTEISKLHLYEISVVTEPACKEAEILTVNETVKSQSNDFLVKETTKMSEEEQKPKEPIVEEETKGEEGGAEDVLAQLSARMDGYEKAQEDLFAAIDEIRSAVTGVSEGGAEEAKSEEEESCTKCAKKAAATAELRKKVEYPVKKSVAGITDPPGIGGSPAVFSKYSLEDLAKMSVKEIDSKYRQEGL